MSLWWLKASAAELREAETCRRCGCHEADIDLGLCYVCFCAEQDEARRMADDEAERYRQMEADSLICQYLDVMAEEGAL